MQKQSLENKQFDKMKQIIIISFKPNIIFSHFGNIHKIVTVISLF